MHFRFVLACSWLSWLRGRSPRGLKDPPKKEMPSIVGEWIRVDRC